MLRVAAVVFPVALFVGQLKGFVAVAEVRPPPQDVGEALEAWDRIKHSNDVSELEAFIARYKDTFLAKLTVGSSSWAADALSDLTWSSRQRHCRHLGDLRVVPASAIWEETQKNVQSDRAVFIGPRLLRLLSL